MIKDGNQSAHNEDVLTDTILSFLTDEIRNRNLTNTHLLILFICISSLLSYVSKTDRQMIKEGNQSAHKDFQINTMRAFLTYRNKNKDSRPDGYTYPSGLSFYTHPSPLPSPFSLIHVLFFFFYLYKYNSNQIVF